MYNYEKVSLFNFKLIKQIIYVYIRVNNFSVFQTCSTFKANKTWFQMFFQNSIQPED